MTHTFMIQMNDETLDAVVGGTSSRGANTRTINNQQTNNSNIVLQNMSVNAPTNGASTGGLYIGVTQTNTRR